MLTETQLQALIDAIEITDKNGVAWRLETSAITRSLHADGQRARLIHFQIVRAGEEMSGRVRVGSDRTERELRVELSGVARAIVNGELPSDAIEYI